MIRTIDYRKMDEYLRLSDDLCDYRAAIDYLHDTDHKEYKRIVDYYCKEACEMNSCVHCDLFDETFPQCKGCSNEAFERFFEREAGACLDEYIDTTQKILEVIAVQAAWAIAEKAAEIWIKSLNDTVFYRIISNADLAELLHQAQFLYDPNGEGIIDTTALIAARRKLVGDLKLF